MKATSRFIRLFNANNALWDYPASHIVYALFVGLHVGKNVLVEHQSCSRASRRSLKSVGESIGQSQSELIKLRVNRSNKESNHSTRLLPRTSRHQISQPSEKSSKLCTMQAKQEEHVKLLSEIQSYNHRIDSSRGTTSLLSTLPESVSPMSLAYLASFFSAVGAYSSCPAGWAMPSLSRIL